MKYLSEDDPELCLKAREHVLDWHEDEDRPIFCKKCGKKAVQKTNLLWVCPELVGIDNDYFHPG